MNNFKHHFEPLRPNRANCGPEKYEFAHGSSSVCVYDIDSLDFIKEIAVGDRPDCHAVSIDNKYLYIACKQGLYCISQESLEVVKVLETGHVYGTNMLPDGDTMLLHDAFGGILVIKGVCSPDKVYIYKQLQLRRWNDELETLGGKGDFLEDFRYYLCNGWTDSSMYLIDIRNDFSFETFIKDAPALYRSDDLVINREQTLAFSACYSDAGYIAVTDIAKREVVCKIDSGNGTCGLTMNSDKGYVIASNDGESSITVLDTNNLMKQQKYSASDAFDKLGITGCIQGISCGSDDCVYVYECGGKGALVRFYPFCTQPCCQVSYPGGYYKSHRV